MANVPTKFRAKIQGSTGRSVRLPTAGAGGAQIGVNLALPDGSIPTLAQLVAALQTVLVTTQPGNIVAPSGPSTIPWTSVLSVPPTVTYAPRYVPEESDQGEEYGRMAIPGPQGPRGLTGLPQQLVPDDPDDPLVIPGPAGTRGPAGLTITLMPEDPDDPIIVPGVAGAAGAQGPTGGVGPPGFPIVVYADDPDDPPIIPGITGATGARGLTGAAGPMVVLYPDDVDDVPMIPGSTGAAGAAGVAGIAGALGVSAYFTFDDDDIERFDVSGASVGPNQSFQSLVLNPATGQLGLLINQDPGGGSGAIRINVATANTTGAGAINIVGPAVTRMGIQFSQTASSFFFVGQDPSLDALVFKSGGAGGIVRAQMIGAISGANPGGWEIMTNLSIDKPAGNVQPGMFLNQSDSDLEEAPMMAAIQPGRFSGSFTGTLTGCTTAPTAAITYTVDKISGIVVLTIPTLTAVSNTTACTITGLPAVLQPGANTYTCPADIENNTIIGTGAYGAAQIAPASGTITLLVGGSASGFTASGTKGINASTFTYALT